MNCFFGQVGFINFILYSIMSTLRQSVLLSFRRLFAYSYLGFVLFGRFCSSSFNLIFSDVRYIVSISLCEF